MEKREEWKDKGKRVIKIRNIALPFASPSFRPSSILRFSGGSIYPALEWEENPRYARQKTDASNSDDRSARDSEERRNKVEKVSNRRDAAARRRSLFIRCFILYTYYTLYLSFSFVVCIEWNFFRSSIMPHRLSTDWSAKDYTEECNKKGTKRRYVLRTLFVP